ncbi:acyl-CoA dehydrogenase family protein [Mangrovihabitans endophyticus]|uniref:Acyl-CoA dehydrogenase n=1 Tax=Mangrovihabitans endophyticus TaxID=1751298 RepID=A0A8J3FMB3_9ACTN|nr:acyl-CoA dehydrogenase family protein [Mangrovihabitans endophyticus]GGK74700.1 acyl-CoA dehydrogenase [Mangrovihabitans endophyticus]
MQLVFTPEQEELREAVRRFFAAKSSSAAVRALMEDATGYDAAVWKQMATQLGVQGIAIPERFGGSGFSFVELAVVLEEAGRALLAAPLFSSAVLAAYAILDSGDEAAAGELLPGIADGTRIGTLACTEDSGQWDLGALTLPATADGAGWRLSGVKSFVVDGHAADLLVVAARTPNGLSLFAVDGSAPGLGRTALPTLDQTRKLARIVFDDVPARLVGADGGAAAALTRTLDKAVLALAAEQVGGAQRVLEMAVDYAKVRHQFGRPIGSFQAIKHKAAEMLLRVESAKAAAYYGAWAVADDSEEVPAMASLAKAYCSEAYFFAAAENIQIHGGVGFTWEHDAHLYFKRAKSSQMFLGDGTFHRERLLQRIGV